MEKFGICVQWSSMENRVPRNRSWGKNTKCFAFLIKYKLLSSLNKATQQCTSGTSGSSKWMLQGRMALGAAPAFAVPQCRSHVRFVLGRCWQTRVGKKASACSALCLCSSQQLQHPRSLFFPVQHCMCWVHLKLCSPGEQWEQEIQLKEKLALWPLFKQRKVSATNKAKDRRENQGHNCCDHQSSSNQGVKG